MASKAVMDAVLARVTANWTWTPIFGINAREGEAPVDGSAFFTIQYPTSDRDQISVGSPGAQVIREEGGIRFVLSVPRGEGLATWQARLETLLALFQSQKFSGMTTFTPTMPTQDDNNGQGNYFLLTSVIPYQANTLG